MNKRTIVRNICTALIVSILTVSCSLVFPPGELSDSTELLIRDSSFTLEWSYDTTSLSQFEMSTHLFNIYAKEKPLGSWMLLDTKNVYEDFSYRIDRDILNPGKYVFAVSIFDGTKESELHSSEDSDTIPVGGWFINWIPSD